MECRRGSLFTELADLIVETFQPSRLIIFMYQRGHSIPPFLESCQLLNFTICTVHVLYISEGGGGGGLISYLDLGIACVVQSRKKSCGDMQSRLRLLLFLSL